MKTPCPDEEILAGYLEKRLSGRERSEMEEHLAGCDICLQEVVVAGSVVRGGDGLKLNPAPSGVTRSPVRLVSDRSPVSSGSPKRKLKRFFDNLCSRISDYFHPAPWGEWGLAPIRGEKKKDLCFSGIQFYTNEAESQRLRILSHFQTLFS